MFQTIITILGVIASALFIGFLAYSIHSVPLWVIVVVTYALMIREFIIELRGNGERGNHG